MNLAKLFNICATKHHCYHNDEEGEKVLTNQALIQKPVLKEFGNYFILDFLAEGGMSKVFRAIPLQKNTNQLCIIKCVGRVEEGQDRLQNMFQSEIKVMVGLDHPNIVKMLDIGEAMNQPYIAMEYVSGHSLKDLLDKMKALRTFLPIKFALYITEQIANGIHYAYGFKNPITREALHIIHRDINPKNILISYTGEIKIIDFGVAKAKTNLDETQPGIIKGKLYYLSPEQLHRVPLDGRSDIFSLGTTLWEMLTGRRLFQPPKNTPEQSIFNLIEKCDTSTRPPSQFNSEVPSELDEIVFRSLTHNRENRYQTAEEFQIDLHRCLYSHFPNFQPSLFAQEFQKWFQQEMKAEQSHLKELIQKSNSSFELPKLETSMAHSIPAQKEDFLQTGMPAPHFKALTYDMKLIDFSATREKKVWLCIYRQATCPFCSLHLWQIVKQHEKLVQQGIQVIAVYESYPTHFLKKGTGKLPALLAQAPFPLISDPHKMIYKAYRTRKSIKVILHPFVLFSLIKAYFRGFFIQSLRGHLTQAPAHFLISKDGTIHTAYYGKTAIDHIPWNLVEAFGNSKN